MEKRKFKKLVTEAIEELPKSFKEKMENVYVVVEDFPSREIMKQQKLRSAFNILGLYQGIPLKTRGLSYTNVLPDKITIYQKSIESICDDEIQVRKRIKEVLMHEVGHHFGFNEKELAEI